jgi:hypothetical protein
MNSPLWKKAYQLDIRPSSYWVPLDLMDAILRNVQGEERKWALRRTLEQGGPLPQDWLTSALDDDTRNLLSRLHPRWMGGEYLPPYAHGEVEIARIVLDSTTQDVYSVRAHPDQQGIAYRIVDEYQERWTIPITRSEDPLTLRELIHLIDGARFGGSQWTDLTDALRDDAVSSDPAEAVDFVLVQSSFYPELEPYYREKARAWLETRRRDVSPSKLAKALQSRDPEERLRAVEAGLRSGEAGIRAVLKSLERNASYWPRGATELVQRSAPETVPLLIGMRADTDESVRAAAGEALAIIGAQAVPYLAAAMREEWDQTQQYLRYCIPLGQIGVAALPALRQILDAEHEDPVAVRGAAAALSVIGKTARSAGPSLLRWLAYPVVPEDEAEKEAFWEETQWRSGYDEEAYQSVSNALRRIGATEDLIDWLLAGNRPATNATWPIGQALADDEQFGRFPVALVAKAIQLMRSDTAPDIRNGLLRGLLKSGIGDQIPSPVLQALTLDPKISRRLHEQIRELQEDDD